MRLFVVPLAALLFIALSAPSYAQSEVVVTAGSPLAVECSLRVEQRAEWRVDGGRVALQPDLRAAEQPASSAAPPGTLRAVLAAPAARPQHAGLYTCARNAPPVRVRVLPASVPPAPALHGEPSTAAPPVPKATAAGAGAGAGADSDVVQHMYEVGRAITLNCTADDAPPSITYAWTKNKTAVETVEELKDRYETLENGAVLRVRARTNEEDYGEYACWVGGSEARTWHVYGRPVAKLSPNVNVVEGQKLKVVCKVIGKPYPPVEWRYAAAGENETAVAGERASFSDSPAGVPGGQLELKEAVREDAGTYSCVPLAAAALSAHTVLRVKGMYDALWPFLGICIEVFLLCAIILVYEKRRTKTEHEDSDTDNHDQKKS